MRQVVPCELDALPAIPPWQGHSNHPRSCVCVCARAAADRDRNLHISGGYVAASSGRQGPGTAAEVMNLAAVLTKQALPMHYRVTSEGGKVL